MNKSLYNYAGIISIVIGVLYCFTLVGIVVGVPLIIGGSIFIDYSKMSDEQLKEKKTNILVWTIIFFLFTMVSGVIALIAFLELENSDKPQVEPKASTNSNLKSKLLEVKELMDDGLITEAEYEKRKTKILEEE